MNPPAAFFHTVPLHYVPILLLTGSLFSQEALAAAGLPIHARPTAARRDRKLHLSRYVHLSLVAATPLLADKIRRGYLHALVEFAPEVADLPDAGYIPYNTKAWRHREDYAPITDPAGRAAFVAAWAAGRYRSAELLVPDALPLAPYARALHFASQTEYAWLRDLADILAIDVRPEACVSAGLFPCAPDGEPNLDALVAYSMDCRAAGHLLPPPDLPFD